MRDFDIAAEHALVLAPGHCESQSTIYSILGAQCYPTASMIPSSPSSAQLPVTLLIPHILSYERVGGSDLGDIAQLIVSYGAKVKSWYENPSVVGGR